MRVPGKTQPKERQGADGWGDGFVPAQDLRCRMKGLGFGGLGFRGLGSYGLGFRRGDIGSSRVVIRFWEEQSYTQVKAILSSCLVGDGNLGLWV